MKEIRKPQVQEDEHGPGTAYTPSHSYLFDGLDIAELCLFEKPQQTRSSSLLAPTSSSKASPRIREAVQQAQRAETVSAIHNAVLSNWETAMMEEENEMMALALERSLHDATRSTHGRPQRMSSSRIESNGLTRQQSRVPSHPSERQKVRRTQSCHFSKWGKTDSFLEDAVDENDKEDERTIQMRGRSSFQER